jgi:Holliday junction resolvase RusA-like endonuclease
MLVGLMIHRRMPKDWSKAMRAIMDGQLTEVTPDPTNVAMLYADALSGIAWRDDKQVHWRFIEQRWAAVDEVIIEITAVGKES